MATKPLPLFALLSGFVTSLALFGCSGDSGTGPAQVRWNRTTCDRCRMLLSDTKHAAQLRLSEAEGRSRVYFFDDIGCAIIWLDNNPGRRKSVSEMWVTDWRDGHWLDGQRAVYVPGQITPMGYGLGAQPDPVPGGLDFAAARTHVLDVEQRFNLPPAQPANAPRLPRQPSPVPEPTGNAAR